MKRFFTLFLFAIILGSNAMASDFSAECETGQTLYYNITSDTEPYTVTVELSSNYQYLTGDLVIPESVEYNGLIYSVTSIDSFAFIGCNGLISVTIPNSVTIIGRSAFSNCSGLTSVTIGNSVTSIGDGAFNECIGLTSIVVDPNNQTYDSRDNCNAIIKTATNELLYGCKNTIIPNSVTSIGNSAFCGCRGLTSVTIPNSVTSIGERAFAGCGGLTLVTIGNSVTSIGYNAFSSCEGLTTVNFNAINCTMNAPFEYCTSLSTLNIGENVASIDDYAFGGCSLDSIISAASNPPLIYANTFDFNPLSNIPVVVPCGAVETYNNADFWYNFRRIQQDASCPAQYTITALSNNPNYGTVTGGGVYLENATATLTATPYEEHTFVSWNDGSTENPREITVTGDSTFIATFVRSDINPTIYTEFSASACGNYTWNGIVYTESGDHIQTFTAANSADSIVTLHLTVHPLPQPEITVDGILDACNPETTSVTLSAGDYSEYIWSNGETSSSIVVTSAGNYFVEVVDEHGCHGYSEETSVGYSTILTEAPQIKGIGISRSGGVVIEWRVTSTEGIAGFEIYREDNVANIYTCVKRIEQPGKRSCIDLTANPSARAYRYKICAIDECGGMSPMSEPHKSVHLTINRGIGDNWNLIWSPYEGLDFPSYKIYRGTSLQDMIVIGEVSSNFNSFTDSDNPNNVGFFYQVEVVRNSRTRDGEDEEEVSILSNIVDNGYFPQHTIIAVSYNPMQGTVSGGGIYPEGYLVTLTAEAFEGYTFVSWNDGSTDNPREIAVTSDALYVASFAEISQETRYTITVISANPSQGSVIGSGTYTEGAVVTIAAIANNGYLFGSWSDGNTDNPREITVTCDTTYVASFVPATSIDENIAPEISLFPNPATDILNITSSETISEIEIVNVLGQVVYHTMVNADNVVCDVNGLTAGVYFVKIYGNPRTSTGSVSGIVQKFIKE